MSLINDMLNDLEKNKDSHDPKKKVTTESKTDTPTNSEPDVVLNHDQNDLENNPSQDATAELSTNSESIVTDSPEGTPDMQSDTEIHAENGEEMPNNSTVEQSTTKRQPPQMPPADDAEATPSLDEPTSEIKAEPEVVTQTTASAHADLKQTNVTEQGDAATITADTQTSTDTIDSNSDINEESFVKQYYRQPWESAVKTETDHDTSDAFSTSDKDTTTPTDELDIATLTYRTKKSSNKRLVIWIIIIALVCAVLAYFYFWPSKPKASTSVATPSTLPAVIKPAISIKEDNTTAKTQPVAKNNDTTNAATKSTVADNNKATADNTNSSTPEMKVEAVPVDPKLLRDQQYADLLSQMNASSADEMIVKLKAFISKYPDFVKAKLALAGLLMKANHTAQATQLIDSALAHDPTNRQFAELKAHLLIEKNQVAAAIAILEHAQPASITADPSYFSLLAGLYLQTKQFAQASNLYSSLTQINPHNATYWAGLGISLQKQNNSIAANNAFNKAETIGGLNPALAAYVDQALQGQ